MAKPRQGRRHPTPEERDERISFSGTTFEVAIQALLDAPAYEDDGLGEPDDDAEPRSR